MAQWGNATRVCLTASIFCHFQRITNQAIGGQFFVMESSPSAVQRGGKASKKRGICPAFFTPPSEGMMQCQFANPFIIIALFAISPFQLGMRPFAEFVDMSQMILLPEFFFFIVEHFPTGAEFL